MSKETDIYSLYREVFSTPKGQVVLFHILETLGFHDVAITPEEVTRKNYAMHLLTTLGGGRLDQSSVTEFTKKLMRQPLRQEE